MSRHLSLSFISISISITPSSTKYPIVCIIHTLISSRLHNISTPAYTMGKASRRYISAKQHANKYEGLCKSYAEGRKVPNGKELVANVELVHCKPTQTYDDGGRKKHKSYATGRKKHKPTKTYDDGGRKLKSNKSGKQSVTNENLVKQLMCVAHRSPQLLQRLKYITLMADDMWKRIYCKIYQGSHALCCF